MLPSGTAVLFDLDGTLVDSAPDLAGAMNVLLERHGRSTLGLDRVRNMVGQGARVLMERAMEATGEPASAEQMDRLFDEFIVYYGEHIADHSVPFPGVREALGQLHDAGCPMGVCTNKTEALSRRLLDALDLSPYFTAVVGGDTLPVRKPDPEHVLETMRRVGGTPSTSFMVGDSRADVAAAKAAGVPVVGVTFGYTPEPVGTYGPDVTIDHFDQLADALASLASA